MTEGWYRKESPAYLKRELGKNHLWNREYAKYLAERRSRSATLSIFSVVAKRAETDKTLEQRFYEQANKWRLETQHLSSPLQRMMHPSYQAILGMAADDKAKVVSLLLHDLQDKHGDWFLALSYLTQENPINPNDAGKTDKLVSAWVKWGQRRGLL